MTIRSLTVAGTPSTSPAGCAALPARFGCLRIFQCTRLIHQDERVVNRIELGDAIQRCTRDFDRREFLAPVVLRQFDCGQGKNVIGHVLLRRCAGLALLHTANSKEKLDAKTQRRRRCKERKEREGGAKKIQFRVECTFRLSVLQRITLKLSGFPLRAFLCVLCVFASRFCFQI